MIDALTKPLARSRGVVETATADALRMKAAGLLSSQMAPATGALEMLGGRSKDRRWYDLFRGWTYSAVHALALKAAGQPVNVARMLNTAPATARAVGPNTAKMQALFRMSQAAKSKAGNRELEILSDHPLLDALERPNPIQDRFQFVYSFVTNLNLTGWAYIIMDEDEDGRVEFYSLPTTWVRPAGNAKEGLFSKFEVRNPKKPEVTAIKLTADKVAFAYLPNPSDPISALAPAASQIKAVQIDEHIQTTQEMFFRNGVFPSAVVTIGKNPHPNVPGGIRPRLTGPQHRQVVGVIRRLMQDVHNFGNPAILDGYIEDIKRLSMSQTEMGWEKSEGAVRTRILSAHGVHPHILGEPMNVGGHAQAQEIWKIFSERVNVFLDMLGTVMSNFSGATDEDGKLLVWWDECVPVNPALRSKEWLEARKAGDVSRDEFRTNLGLPPIDGDQWGPSPVYRQALPGVVQLLVQVGNGLISHEQAAAALEQLGVPEEDALRIAGSATEGERLERATEALELAVDALRTPPKLIANEMVEAAR